MKENFKKKLLRINYKISYYFFGEIVIQNFNNKNERLNIFNFCN